ncbi:MAG TPA: exosortase/archaeosortase family protein [Candidatus Sulfotelmatobacter sp.]|jgi:exosortase|nr:exosortase/archaeosortase family protein [Candidatus Sulfotelmatobacter sp.]
MKQTVRSAATEFPLVATNRRASLLAIAYSLACILPAIFMWDLLKDLLALILNDETYSHIPAVLAVSAFFLITDRQRIFTRPSGQSGMPAAIALAGAASMALARVNPWYWSESNQISLLVLGFVLFWAGAFGIFFGENAMRAARFPLLFLWFAIPIPKTVLSEMIALLQRGSADAVDVVFRLFHTPAVRQGFDFALPGITVRVAEECSGIRSTLALVMASVLAGHLWLRSFWRTLLLCLATVPISIVKNALRIAVLSWLAVYVDPRFLTGSIHHQYGGILFFGVGLLMMAGVLALLQRPQSRVPSGERQIPSN